MWTQDLIKKQKYMYFKLMCLYESERLYNDKHFCLDYQGNTKILELWSYEI